MVGLGDEVKDTVTGFKGITVCRCSYLQGCDRFAVQAPVTKKNPKKQDWEYFDEPQLKVLRKNVVNQGDKGPGGYQPDSAER